MRILFIIHTWHPEGRGGTERHAREVALALQERGHQVGIFTRTARPERPRFEVTTEWQGKISVSRINNCDWENQNFESIYKNRRVHEAFEQELKSFQPDLVHVHHLTGLSTTLLELSKQKGLPVIMTLHDFWMICPRGQRMTSNLELCWEIDRNRCFTCLGSLWPHIFKNREDESTVVDERGDLSPKLLGDYDRHMISVLGLCDRIICPSAFHRERMLDFPLNPEALVAFPHGLSRVGFPETPRPPRQPRVIGFIGSVIPIKGVHVLLQAFMKLKRPDLELVIHGEAPPFHEEKNYLAQLTAQAQGLPNIRFTGPYEPRQVPALLRDIDILVVPSLWWESFCLTLREGLLAGAVVVASDLGAMREALDGEQNGVLFAPGDPDDLAAKLTRLLEDPHFYNRHTNRGAVVTRLKPYLVKLEALYEETIRVSLERLPTLKVPLSSFPKTGSPLARVEGDLLPSTLPWSKLGVAVRHQGPLDMSFQTRMPSDEKPALGLDIALREGEREVGQIGVVVDLRTLCQGMQQGGDALRPADQEERKGALEKDSRAAGKTRPERGPLRKLALTRPRNLKSLPLVRASGPLRRLNLGERTPTDAWGNRP